MSSALVSRRTLYSSLIILFSFAAIIVLASLIVGSRDDTDCQRHNYSTVLNGGIKLIANRHYVVSICGSGRTTGLFAAESMELVQLTVADAFGTVLVKRRYKVFWEGRPGHEPIATVPAGIIYSDDEEQKEHMIMLPPTLLDRAMAKLPLF